MISLVVTEITDKGKREDLLDNLVHSSSQCRAVAYYAFLVWSAPHSVSE